MIDTLKSEIERKIKRKIKTRGDCEFLSNAILINMDADVSFNTLRRLFGLLHATNPNIQTLNILSQFIGFKSYLHFSQTYHYQEKLQFSELLYSAIEANDEEEIIRIINFAKKNADDFLSLVIILCRELLHNENYSLIDRLFNLKSFYFDSFSYFEILSLGNSIGLLLRKQKKTDPIILKNKNFLDCVYLTFVDYSNLNHYYGDISKSIMKNDLREDITLFSKSILEFRKFLNNKKTTEINIDENFERKIHPILSGRLLALNLLNKNSNKTLVILNKYHLQNKQNGDFLSRYFELFTTAILIKNIDVMKFLVANVSVNVKYYHQKIHLNSYYLMCLFYYKLTSQKESELKMLANFELDDCLTSYKKYIELFWLIYQFNEATDTLEKIRIKCLYLTISNELNYSYFSEKFLVNYFD